MKKILFANDLKFQVVFNPPIMYERLYVWDKIDRKINTQLLKYKYFDTLVVAFLLFPKLLAFIPKLWKICEKHLISERKWKFGKVPAESSTKKS